MAGFKVTDCFISLTGTAGFFGTDFELVVGFSIDFPVGAGDGLLEV